MTVVDFEPFGTENQINSFAAGNQYLPTITALVGGGYVVAWVSNGQDGSDQGVFFQIYDAFGMPVGSEMQANSTWFDGQERPSVAALADGGFVIAWDSDNQDPSFDTGVYAQRFDALGSAVGGEFRVNTTFAGTQIAADSVGLQEGGYFFTWISYGQDGDLGGIFGQYFDSTGARVGGEIAINSFTAGPQELPAVASLTGGGVIVVWESDGQDGDGEGIYGQRIDAAGNLVGTEFRVNTETENDQTAPSVATLSDGGFVVAWTSVGQDGDLGGIFAQRYDAAGLPVGTEFMVNSTTTADQAEPNIAALTDGGFIVTWTSYGQDGDAEGVFAQAYNADGDPVGSETQINSTTAFAQSNSDVVGLPDGSYVVSWVSAEQDGSGLGVFTQTFSPVLNSAPVVAPDLQVFEITTTIDATQLGLSANEAVTYRVEYSLDLVAGSGPFGEISTGASYGGAKLTISLGGEVLTVSGGITIFNDNLYGDQIDFRPTRSAGDPPLILLGYELDTTRVLLGDTTGSAFAGLALPVAEDLLGAFDFQQTSFTFYDPATGGSLYAVRSESPTSPPPTPTFLTTASSTPVIADQTFDEDTALNFALPPNSFTDPDGDALSYIATLADGSPLPDWLLFDAATLVFSGIPPTNFNGRLNIEVTASDGELEASDVFSLTISSVNDAPVNSNLSVSAVEDGAVLSGQLTADDPDNLTSDLEFVLSAPVAGLTLNANGSWSFDPSDPAYQHLAQGAIEAISAVFTVTDPGGLSDTGTLTIDITGTNDIPTIDGSATSVFVPDSPQWFNDAGDQRGSIVIENLANGGYVVGWVSNLGNDGDTNILLQIFDPEGNPTGDPFSVAPPGATFQNGRQFPDIELLDNGNFVVTWQQLGFVNGYSLRARVFESDGTPATDDFAAMNYQTGLFSGSETQVVDAGGGNFWVFESTNLGSGSGRAIYAQEVSSDGVLIGGRVLVSNPSNSQDPLTQIRPEAVTLENGDIVVAWVVDGGGLNSDQIEYRVFSSEMSPLGPVQVIDADVGLTSNSNSLAALANGGFVLSWEASTEEEVRFQVFDENYESVGGVETVIVNSSNSYISDVTSFADGSFVFAWYAGFEIGALGQRFSADGAPIGDTFVINSNPNLASQYLNIIGLDQDSFAVTYNGPRSQIFSLDTVGGPVSVEAVEDGSIQSGQLVADDVDDGAVLTFALDAPIEGLTLAADGSWSFDPAHAAYQGLAEGEVLEIDIDYSVSDEFGASTPGVMQLIVTGTNDAPILTQSSTVRFSWSDVIDGTQFGLSSSEPISITIEYERDAAITGGDGNTKLAYGPVTMTISFAGDTIVRVGEVSIFEGLSIGDLINFAVTADFSQTLGGFRFGSLGLTFPDRSGALLEDLSLPDVTELFAQLTSQQFVLTLNDPANGQNLSVFDFGSDFVFEDLTPETIEDVTTLEDEAFSFTIPTDAFIDPDGDALIYSASLANGDPLPAWVNFDPDTLEFSGTPPLDFNGALNIEIVASDGQLQASDVFTLTIAPVNDDPVAVDDLPAEPTPVPAGPETQVNTLIAGTQDAARVTSFADGSYLVVWATGAALVDQDIAGQFFDADGNPLGSEFLINQDLSGLQYVPSVAQLEGGGFVVSWMSWFHDGDPFMGAFARVFDASGNPVTGDLHLNTFTAGGQAYVEVVGLSGGGFAASWESEGQDGSGYSAVTRVFDAAGNAISNEVIVNQSSAGDQNQPAMIATADGGYMVVWTSNPGNGSGQVLARHFDANGAPTGPEFVVSDDPAGDHLRADVVALEDGSFVAVWEARGEIYARVFSQDGTPLSAEFQANSYTFGAQWLPVAVALSDGGFVLSWSSYFADGDGYAISGQRFDAAGNALGSEFLINSETAGNQWSPDLAATADGNLVATWHASDAINDGDGSGVFSRTFLLPDGAGVAPTTESAPANIFVLTNDFDLDGDSLFITAASLLGGAGGTVTVASDGQSIAFDPAGQFEHLAQGQIATVEIGYTISDGNGGSDSAVAYLQVIGENDPPQAVDDQANVDEDAFVIGNLITGPGADSDIDGDALSVVSAGGQPPYTFIQGAYGQLYVLPDGTYYYLANADITDTLVPGTIVEDVFDYTISDGSAIASARLSVSVTAIDDGIVIQPTRSGGTVNGTAGDDVIYGGRGEETVFGGDGFDQISGDRGNDTLYGGGGIDLLAGGRGDDILIGGAGDDLLIGGSGSDTMTGGSGSDIFVIGGADRSRDSDLITDFEVGVDSIFLDDNRLITGFEEVEGHTILHLSNGAEIFLQGVTGINDVDQLLTATLPSWFVSSTSLNANQLDLSSDFLLQP